MSSQTSDKLTDKLQRAYHAVLLQIGHSLEKDQQKELCFCCNVVISKDNRGFLHIIDIIHSLEYAGKMSWIDVRFLKEGLRVIQRLDLVKILTTFEIKRDMSVLLDLYARKRKGSKSCYRSASVELVAGYLVKLTMEPIVRDWFDVSNITSLTDIKEVLDDFEEVSERELSTEWSKLTLLVVIAGEIIAEALRNEDRCRKTEVLDLCSVAADELCSRMMKLGSWVRKVTMSCIYNFFISALFSIIQAWAISVRHISVTSNISIPASHKTSQITVNRLINRTNNSLLRVKCITGWFCVFWLELRRFSLAFLAHLTSDISSRRINWTLDRLEVMTSEILITCCAIRPSFYVIGSRCFNESESMDKMAEVLTSLHALPVVPAVKRHELTGFYINFINIDQRTVFSFR